MKEVCKVAHKKLRKNFQGLRTFLSGEIYLRQV